MSPPDAGPFPWSEPGAKCDPEDYAEEGFIRAIEDSGLPVDALAVDAHVGYYYSRSLLVGQLRGVSAVMSLRVRSLAVSLASTVLDAYIVDTPKNRVVVSYAIGTPDPTGGWGVFNLVEERLPNPRGVPGDLPRRER